MTGASAPETCRSRPPGHKVRSGRCSDPVWPSLLSSGKLNYGVKTPSVTRCFQILFHTKRFITANSAPPPYLSLLKQCIIRPNSRKTLTGAYARIFKGTLRDFGERHPDAQAALDEWYRIARRAHWTNPAQIRAHYADASFIAGDRPPSKAWPSAARAQGVDPARPLPSAAAPPAAWTSNSGGGKSTDWRQMPR